METVAKYHGANVTAAYPPYFIATGSDARFSKENITMKTAAALTLCLGIMVSGNLATQAQIIPLPQSTFREELGRLAGDTGPVLDLHRPETDSYSFSRTVGEHTGTGSMFVQILSSPTPSLGGPVLKVSGSGFNQGNPPALPVDLYAGGASAKAEVDYYFRVIASPEVISVPIVLPINFALHVDREGKWGGALAQWSVDVRREFTQRGVANISNAAHIGPRGNNTVDTEDEVGTEILRFNAFNGGPGSFTGSEYYRVRMTLVGVVSWEKVMADAFGEAHLPATGSFEAMLDPLPQVDPDFAALNPGIQFEFSDNLFQEAAAVAAPEPASLALFALAGGVAFVSRRRERKRG